MKLNISLERTLRKIEVPFQDTFIPFDLNLSVLNVNDLTRLVLNSLYVEGIETNNLRDLSLKIKNQEKLISFTENYLSDTFLVRERVIDQVKKLMDEKKISLATTLKDIDGKVIDENIICSSVIFNNFLFDVGHAVLAWNESVEDVKKKSSWLSACVRTLTNLRLKRK